MTSLERSESVEAFLKEGASNLQNLLGNPFYLTVTDEIKIIHTNPITTQRNILDTKGKVYTNVFFFQSENKWKN